MNDTTWRNHPMCEVLRPASGWEVDRAILATYSADLVVVVASLLALSGCDCDGVEKGSNLELVRAVERLRGRVRVLAQQGRVVLPPAPRVILALMDQFLAQVRTDEREHSWHPKVAVVRCTAPDEAAEWRVWIGSRNLTQAMNWDAGITLIGREKGRGREVPGLADLGATLAEKASFDAGFFRTALSSVRWQFPPGVILHRVQLLSKDAALGLPACPSDSERVVVVSPFLDRKVVAAAAGWGCNSATRTLLSTPAELTRIAANNPQVFKGFAQTRVLSPPDLPERAIAVTGAGEKPAVAVDQPGEEEGATPEGLHAKLIYFGKPSERRLWIGSANGSQRAWKGGNFEVVAELSISPEHVDEIERFVADGQEFVATGAQPIKPDATEEALEAARKRIAAAWLVEQRFDGDHPVLIARELLDSGDPNIAFEVAVLGQAWKHWPPNVLELKLPAVRAWERTALIQVRLTLGDKSCAWLQSAPIVTPMPDRDREVIGQYLDMRSFLQWVRSALDGDPLPPDGVPWDYVPGEDGDAPDNNRGRKDNAVAPTVEDILKAWARSPKAFGDADARVRSYLAAQRQRAADAGRAEDLRVLEDFATLWEMVGGELSASS